MALFTSIDQVSKPTTANNKTPKRQFDIEYHNEEFPYIIINNVFDTEEKKRLIWEELDFLRGKEIRLLENGSQLAGIGMGINSVGALQIRIANGTIRSVYSGDVTLS